jgi:hypothetical protein
VAVMLPAQDEVTFVALEHPSLELMGREGAASLPRHGGPLSARVTLVSRAGQQGVQTPPAFRTMVPPLKM